ncbi:MAG: prepilin-type N-terminal cleavage/methylation domain-containing protein, partial [Erysipelotrichaceae bacterium]|nr:prepilin-type N-terminal cleavage/methylation domain-containing protein [Erysipelotrichaceae bacterium]
MKKENKKKKGFTLIELLATIFIISLILGISGSYIISTINTSKEKSEKLAIANIKTTARIYIEENPNDVLWQIDEENTEKSYSCISIDTLINKGLLKKELKENYPTVKYIIITKDNNNNFLSEKIDNTNTCSKNNNTVKIPTSTKYCNDLTYDSTTENQKLTKTPTDHFQFYDDLKKDAGTYKVTAKLEEGYIWQDGTKEDKTITCTIKKAFPMLVLDPNGEDNTNIEIGKDLTTKLTSNVDGKITIKPANKNYATAKTSDNNPNITATTPKEITITPLATRKINTTITITLTPTDTNNYYSSSINYTIGSPEKTKVPIPTS